MDNKKRCADVQITPVDVEPEDEGTQPSDPPSGKRIVKVKLDIQSTVDGSEETKSPQGFGFQAYKALDPFATASIPCLSSVDTSRKSLSSLTIPSPKSPKTNPFSKPSPVHNPFMTIVDSKDELWNAVARASSAPDKLETISSSSAALPPAPPSLNASSNSVPPILGTVDESANRFYGKIYRMSGNGALVTGEEDEECALQVRAKLFKLNQRKSNVDSKDATTSANGDAVTTAITTDVSRDWVEVGVGPVKLLRPAQPEQTDDASNGSCGAATQSAVGRVPRLVMRRESKVGGTGTKLLLNVLLNKYVTLNKAGDKMFRLSCMHQDEDALGMPTLHMVHTVFLFRTKLIQESDQLFDAIQQAIEGDSECTAREQVKSSSAPQPSD